jgi:hypothetical protein
LELHLNTGQLAGMVRQKLGLRKLSVAQKVGIRLGHIRCGFLSMYSFDAVTDKIGIGIGQRHKFRMRPALKGRAEQKDHPNGSDRCEKQKWPDNTNPMTATHGYFLYKVDPSASNNYSVPGEPSWLLICENCCLYGVCVAEHHMACNVLTAFKLNSAD